MRARIGRQADLFIRKRSHNYECLFGLAAGGINNIQLHVKFMKVV